MKEQISEKEKILEYITEENVVELAKNLIKIPSPTEEETEVAKFLEKYMRDNGLETEMVEVEAGRLQPIGRVKGTGGGYSLMFNGHMDTDVIVMGLKDPYVPRIEGRRLYGHGIFNMKAGLTAMVEAAIAIKKSGVKLKGDLVVTLVVGELQGGVGTVANIKRGILADFGLVPEPKSEVFCLMHVGVEQIEITLRGESRHASDMRPGGIHLAAKMAKVIDAIYNMKFSGTPDPRLPGVPKVTIGSAICGRGETYNLKGASFLPDICTIIVDVRFYPGMRPPHEDIEKVMERLKSEDPELRYEMRPTPDDPDLPGMLWKNFRLTMPAHDLSPDELIVKVHAQNYKYLTGKEPFINVYPSSHAGRPTAYAGNDDCHLTRAGVLSFAMGPITDWTGPSLEQSADIDSMVLVSKNYALTAYDICTKSKE